jgi:lysyl-tRNA synthetase class 2
LFLTKTGELSVHVEKLQFLAKALLPMPDKLHGINDPEIRQRQRYADLIAGSLKIEESGAGSQEPGKKELSPREVFEMRAKVLREIRRFLDERDYVEVETPMLTPLATGAAAKPFQTYHNTLGIPLYARIAPELYLKRLTVGGFERVYELNRNFRNEGISTKHNPEFTMLEYYWAYADVNQMMDMHEEMMRSVVQVATGGLTIRYGFSDPMVIDFSPRFQRLTMKDAIARYLPALFEKLGEDRFDRSWLDDPEKVMQLVLFYDAYNEEEATIKRLTGTKIEHGMEMTEAVEEEIEGIEAIDTAELWFRTIESSPTSNALPNTNEIASHIVRMFEEFVEPRLEQPTFITEFPKPVSPLSKASPADPSVAERFEYFVGGLESANGFSELNDPEEQYQRFKDQVQQRERGDEEAMVMDEDYIRALSYGMPPAAGIGVGIDRLVMLLANKHSIRDVILFPHLRPAKGRESGDGSRESE